jgi:hypothetical protein
MSTERFSAARVGDRGIGDVASWRRPDSPAEIASARAEPLERLPKPGLCSALAEV